MAFVRPESSSAEASSNAISTDSAHLNLLELKIPDFIPINGPEIKADLSPADPTNPFSNHSVDSSSNKSADHQSSNKSADPADISSSTKPTDLSTKPRDLADNHADKPVEDPIVAIRKAQEAQIYPELALTRQAMEALKEPVGTAKEKWEKANAFFHIAEVQVEKYIEYQGGLNKIFHNVNQLAEELYKAIDDFSKSKRGISGADYPGKAADEAALRQQLTGMSKQDQLASIRGEKGAQLRESLFKMFNDDEKEIFSEIDVALNKVQLLSSIKLQHALAANKFGIENNEVSAKILAENILKSIAASDPETFKNNPEIRGLILQSERGEAMDLSEGKAFATAFTEEARKTIITTLTGVDALIDGEARRLGAERAVGLLVAALLANDKVTRAVWQAWTEGKNYSKIFSSAEAVIAAQKVPSS